MLKASILVKEDELAACPGIEDVMNLAAHSAIAQRHSSL